MSEVHVSIEDVARRENDESYGASVYIDVQAFREHFDPEMTDREDAAELRDAPADVIHEALEIAFNDDAFWAAFDARMGQAAEIVRSDLAAARKAS